ncbi:MAG: hypothetical protein RJB38_1354 [Pseudomonadota bacterium]|jgi:hypothetical protein
MLNESRNRHEPFDRQKYLDILRAQGLATALTALHRDIEQLEYETFEGLEGWKPELFEKLKAIRDFSRELWDVQLHHPEQAQGRSS